MGPAGARTAPRRAPPHRAPADESTRPGLRTHSKNAAGRRYGHVALYVGDGKVCDSEGYARTMDLVDWLAYYGDLVQPRWGWLGGAAIA